MGDDFAAIAELAAEKALAKFTARPPCGLNQEGCEQVSHLMCMVKGLGDDSYARGIEVMRRTNRFAMKYQQLCNRTGQIVLGLVVAAVFAVIWMIASKGTKDCIRDLLLTK